MSSSRVEEMRVLRYKNYTLREIGDMYGISGERVRQLIKIGGGNSFRSNNAAKILEGITNKSVFDERLTPDIERELLEKSRLSRACLDEHGIFPGIHRLVKGDDSSSLKKGVASEDKFSRLLAEKGIENSLSGFGDSYDIILKNGKKIDVKFCSKKVSFKGHNKSERYNFHIRASKKNNAIDFYVLLLGDCEDVFIIPAEEMGGRNKLYLFWPEKTKRVGKFSKFVNAFAYLL